MTERKHREYHTRLYGISMPMHFCAVCLKEWPCPAVLQAQLTNREIVEEGEG